MAEARNLKLDLMVKKLRNSFFFGLNTFLDFLSYGDTRTTKTLLAVWTLKRGLLVALGVFSLKRSTARAFGAPFGALNQLPFNFVSELVLLRSENISSS